jgi:hypothetical protein
MNVPVCRRSKAQRGETLSSSEAEYVAISEAVKEIKFIYYLLQGIGINIEPPIIVKTDNIGAMFMAQNTSSGVRTRHVDTRYHYIRENVEDGIIKIEFVRSMENDSDIFTKNVTQEIYEKHVRNFFWKTLLASTMAERFGIGSVLEFGVIPYVQLSFLTL